MRGGEKMMRMRHIKRSRQELLEMARLRRCPLPRAKKLMGKMPRYKIEPEDRRGIVLDYYMAEVSSHKRVCLPRTAVAYSSHQPLATPGMACPPTVAYESFYAFAFYALAAFRWCRYFDTYCSHASHAFYSAAIDMMNKYDTGADGGAGCLMLTEARFATQHTYARRSRGRHATAACQMRCHGGDAHRRR